MKLKHRSILSLHVELHHWDDAFAMERLYPELRGMVSLQYAEWLVHNDCFAEAHVCYKEAGRPDLSEQLLKKLVDNGVTACIPFQDITCFYLFMFCSLQPRPSRVYYWAPESF